MEAEVELRGVMWKRYQVIEPVYSVMKDRYLIVHVLVIMEDVEREASEVSLPVLGHSNRRLIPHLLP
jgi:hypothetical protein